ncbi:unnamed protein product [Bubo scandiacus]
MLDWSNSNEDQHIVLSAAEQPSAEGTEEERAAVPTPTREQQGGTTGLCQTQEAAPGQLSPVSLEPQQKLLALAKASVSHDRKLESN